MDEWRDASTLTDLINKTAHCDTNTKYASYSLSYGTLSITIVFPNFISIK